MRVSDEQRQRVIDELRRHCAAGRLDLDEYGDRLEQALGASSLEDLDRALGDLPMMRIADPVGSTSVPGHRSMRGGSRSGGTRRRWAVPTGDGTATGDDTANGIGGGSPRWAATAVVLTTVMVVLATTVLVVTAHWTWSVVLVGGWVLGRIQAWVAHRG